MVQLFFSFVFHCLPRDLIIFPNIFQFELGISSTEDVKKVGLSKQLSSKDKSMETIVKKHKRSKESLLDAHQKKLKEEKKVCNTVLTVVTILFEI